MNGSGTIVGKGAKQRTWREWCIVMVAGRLLAGRVIAQVGVPGSSRRLSPVYDFTSGFMQLPEGLREMHRMFPFLALTIKGIDLPDHGVVLIPFSDFDEMELDGLISQVENAEDLAKQMAAARSNLVLAPASALPKPKV